MWPAGRQWNEPEMSSFALLSELTCVGLIVFEPESRIALHRPGKNEGGAGHPAPPLLIYRRLDQTSL
jgi:hypothetical protein